MPEVEIDLPDEHWAAIDAYAAEKGLTRNEAFLQILDKALDHWDALPEEEKQRQVEIIKAERAGK